MIRHGYKFSVSLSITMWNGGHYDFAVGSKIIPEIAKHHEHSRVPAFRGVESCSHFEYWLQQLNPHVVFIFEPNNRLSQEAIDQISLILKESDYVYHSAVADWDRNCWLRSDTL